MPDINVVVRPPDRALQRAELACKLVSLAYGLFMAWQMAKIVCPPLAVHEQVLIQRVARYLPRRPRQATQREADDFVAAVTRHVREEEA